DPWGIDSSVSTLTGEGASLSTTLLVTGASASTPLRKIAVSCERRTTVLANRSRLRPQPTEPASLGSGSRRAAKKPVIWAGAEAFRRTPPPGRR
ncbi:MAG: hypothetical protein WBK88_09380, partial [Methanothrix sp.]